MPLSAGGEPALLSIWPLMVKGLDESLRGTDSSTRCSSAQSIFDTESVCTETKVKQCEEFRVCRTESELCVGWSVCVREWCVSSDLAQALGNSMFLNPMTSSLMGI